RPGRAHSDPPRRRLRVGGEQVGRAGAGPHAARACPRGGRSRGLTRSRTQSRCGCPMEAEQISDGMPDASKQRRGRIVRRYFLIFVTLVGGSLLVSLLLEMGFRMWETRWNLEVVHRQMAELAALRIRNYIDNVAEAVRLAAQPRHVAQGRVSNEYI